MIQPARSVTHENTEGQWHIEAYPFENLGGDDYNKKLIYFKVKGPNKMRFMYKFRFAEMLIATVRLNLSTQADRITAGLKKTEELIDKRVYSDMIVTGIDSKSILGWKISNAPKGLTLPS